MLFNTDCSGNVELSPSLELSAVPIGWLEATFAGLAKGRDWSLDFEGSKGKVVYGASVLCFAGLSLTNKHGNKYSYQTTIVHNFNQLPIICDRLWENRAQRGMRRRHKKIDLVLKIVLNKPNEGNGSVIYSGNG